MYKDPAKFGSISSHYTIRGGTSIYDAIGVGISGFDIDNANVVVALFTDGGEYDSKAYNQMSALAVVNQVKKKNWTIAYVSPVYNAEQFAGGIGISKGNVLQYESGNSGIRTVFSKLGLAVERYITNIKNGTTINCTTFFSDLEKKAEMKIKKMQVVLNMPRALKSKKDGDNEVSQSLPPYAPVDAYVVDEYPSCPSTWMHGSAKASSYFVGVKPDRGMWLDFNGCDKEYDVAAVISVQGINPITGSKSDSLRLERYENKCPKHNCDFQQDRYCPECGYKWPAQNYLASNATPDGQFWLDGFRSEDGKIRQYIFTEEMARGVANAVIGDEKVYAIGIAFYKSKKKKPVVDVEQYTRGWYSDNGVGGVGGSCGGRGGTLRRASFSKGFVSPFQSMRSVRSRDVTTMGYVAQVAAMPVCATTDGSQSMYSIDSEIDSIDSEIGALTPKSYEVGAGATIDQKLHEDTESLDYWEETTIGMIYVNYTGIKTVEKILAGGKRADTKNGFLAAVPVGN